MRAYPGHETVAVCINYGKIYEVASLEVGDGVTITLNTQIINSLSYTNVRDDYSSDEV